MVRRLMVAGTTLVIMVGLFSGCRMVRNTGKQIYNKTVGQLIVAPALPESPSLSQMQFEDIPVPLNFKHLPDESMVYLNGYVRTAEIKYLGSARVDDLINFYQKQMPLYGWNYQMTLSVDRKKGLAFERRKEQCKVIIEQKGRETYLTIEIHYQSPKG